MATDLRTLPPGHILSEYRIEHVLGQGGFGITYLGTDTHLGRQVAIKEYYPREWATRNNTFTICATGGVDDRRDFDWGLNRFLKEAQLLARFEHPNIIAVRRFFKANGTAYLVMDYCDGRPLDEIIKSSGALSQEQLERIWYPLLDGLEQVHRIGFLHRDIKPANLYIRADGSPVLLDFGSAILENAQHTRGVTVMVADGYAPMEQYDGDGIQGPFTDIYGLAATLYRAVTGEKPQASPGRSINDRIEPAVKKAKGRFAENLLAAIDSGMALRPEDRPQNVAQWRAMLIKKPSLHNKPAKEFPTPPPTPPPRVKPKLHIATSSDTSAQVPSQAPIGPPDLNFRKIYLGLVCVGIVSLFIFLFYKFNQSDFPVASKPTPIPTEVGNVKIAIPENESSKKIFISLFIAEENRSIGGFALDYPSQADADRSAREKCEALLPSNSRNQCVKVAGEAGKCLSVSRDKNGAVGAAIGMNSEAAELAAEQACRKQVIANGGIPNCSISKQETFCGQK